MVKIFLKKGDKNKLKEMNNYKLLDEMGVSQQFVKIYEQNSEET